MQLVTLDQLRQHFDHDAVIAAVRAAFIGHARGAYVVAPPGQLLFESPPGDCHIKYGYAKDGPVFVIKVAAGFYDNPTLGLPVNSGVVLVCSRTTGVPVALLQDDGWLTSWRTAAAGALAASLVAARHPEVLGVFGAGHQAELQATWIARELGLREVRIWARRHERAATLAATLTTGGLNARACATTDAVLAEARVIVTTTPGQRPLFPADEVRAGTHVVAMGADSPGKQELDPALFARAQLVVTDDRAQCVDHGDLFHAVAAGLVRADANESLGQLLAEPGRVQLDAAAISIVDLTGIPAQDVAMATAMCRALGLLSAAGEPAT